MAKTDPARSVESMEVGQFRLGGRERRHLYRLVGWATDLHRRLQLRLYAGKEDRARAARTLEALTWALDRLGYPPARYDEVLRDYAPARVRERRRTRAGKPDEESGQ
jgi:hypothetical protein